MPAGMQSKHMPHYTVVKFTLSLLQSKEKLLVLAQKTHILALHVAGLTFKIQKYQWKNSIPSMRGMHKKIPFLPTTIDSE